MASGITRSTYVQELVRRDQDKAMPRTQLLGERRQLIDERRCFLKQMGYLKLQNVMAVYIKLGGVELKPDDIATYEKDIERLHREYGRHRLWRHSKKSPSSVLSRPYTSFNSSPSGFLLSGVGCHEKLGV